LPAKSIFASPVFTMEKMGFSTFWQKPANPGKDSTRKTGTTKLSHTWIQYHLNI